MADLKISQLPVVTTVAGGDVSAVVASGVTSQITQTNYIRALNALKQGNQNGTLALLNGQSTGTVSGLGLPGSPVEVQLTIQSDSGAPSGGLLIFAVLSSNPSADGFTFLMSGATDSANYILHYSCGF